MTTGADARADAGCTNQRAARPEQRSDGDNEKREGRTPAEWASLAVSLAILATVLGLIVYEHVSRGQQPPAFEVRLEADSIREAAGSYHLPVAVLNTGDLTAENVRLEVTLAPIQGAAESSDAEIRFLAGGETQRLTVVFQSNPRAGRLDARVVSFADAG